MNIVLDTNVLVSALWSPGRKAWDIVNAVISRRFTACYNFQMLSEYDRVMHYEKFSFEEWEIASMLEPIITNGISVAAVPLPSVHFDDESDRKFYEVAHFCHAPLITGNIKHFPDEDIVITVSEFHDRYIM